LLQILKSTIKLSNFQTTYLNDKSSFAEAIGQGLLLDYFPGWFQQIERIQQIEFKLDFVVNGVDSSAQQKTAVVHLEVLDDALIHWLKSIKLKS
jgi:hypothetical protein